MNLKEKKQRVNVAYILGGIVLFFIILNFIPNPNNSNKSSISNINSNSVYILSSLSNSNQNSSDIFTEKNTDLDFDNSGYVSGNKTYIKISSKVGEIEKVKYLISFYKDNTKYNYLTQSGSNNILLYESYIDDLTGNKNFEFSGPNGVYAIAKIMVYQYKKGNEYVFSQKYKDMKSNFGSFEVQSSDYNAGSITSRSYNPEIYVTGSGYVQNGKAIVTFKTNGYETKNIIYMINFVDKDGNVLYKDDNEEKWNGVYGTIPVLTGIMTITVDAPKNATQIHNVVIGEATQGNSRFYLEGDLYSINTSK